MILGLAIIIIGAGLAGSMDSIASPTLSVEVLALAGAGEQGRAAAAQGLATPVGVAVPTGLGGTVVRNLPQVEQTLDLEDFIDKPAADKARATIDAARKARLTADEALDQARLKLNAQRADAASARETFDNWLATRRATQLPEQDAELIRRTAALDALKGADPAEAKAFVKDLLSMAGITATGEVTLDGAKVVDANGDGVIPADAKRTASLVGRKCRAEWVRVLEIDGAEEAVSGHDCATVYRVGETVRPDSYDDNPLVECTHGIHWFATRAEAEEY